MADLDPTFTPQEGERNALENVARRWLTPHGTLPGDDDFGRDVRQWLQARTSSVTRARIKAALEQEARKEERVRKCTVTVTATTTGLSIVGVVEVDMARTFRLTLNVTEFAAVAAIEAA